MTWAQQRPAAKAAPRRVTILGSTGSVGCSTLDLIGRTPEAFKVVALSANGSVARLAAQARQVGAEIAVVADERQYGALKEALSGSGIEAAAGAAALCEAAARPVDWVMAAIVGAAGLAPTLAAVRQGAIVALANKEALVCAGALVTAEVARCGATLLPVDSEHNAIFQVLDFDRLDSVERIILTASGGPFRAMARSEMASVTPEQAVAHPNWDMGAKISVDSATMMNKGLELIEAHHLFGLPDTRIEILVHPQSVVHSMVAYVDGSVLAQMGLPDMRTPIAYTLAWPARMATPVERLDLARIGQLTFEAPDPDRFPALRLARAALQAGGIAPTVLNAANEIAVQGFLDRRIGFLDIAAVVEETLERLGARVPSDLADILEADCTARAVATSLLS
ncbi:MAG: 1-deoxy-D-xylulose-5-phosphate reductoisomerase [Alphaproteobacteria bacterium]|nr:MAG: 1-deoxy-D-xylulose-5-phosphate reductoisomerase [Alphaproteobacteria bacterium]